MLVVLFHLWPDRVTGGYVGVDVFFVISGYLITSHLMREVDRTGTISLSQFYARRIRRLLPAALLVLAVTAVAVLLWVPRSLWQLFSQEIGASALYFVNWMLAFSSVDYFAADNAPSPVQHYWSLSVEEQFYLVWPLLVLVVVLITRTASAIVRKRALIGTFAVVFLVCLTYSVIATNASQQFAYFTTPAHGWEFAAGGILALALPNTLEGAPRLRAALSWVGFMTVLASGFIFNADSAFPGYIALLPTVGALLILAAGISHTAWSPRRIVELRPVQFVGDVSYSLYLWHWMPIVILPYILDRDLGIPQKLLILVGAIVLAWLTKILVEDPVRSAPRMRHRRVTYPAALLASALVVALCAVPYVTVETTKSDAVRYLSEHGQTTPEEARECFGAAAAEPGADCADSHTVIDVLGPVFASNSPQASSLRVDTPGDPYFNKRCERVGDTGISRCDIGSRDPDETIVLVGDSHVNHVIKPFLALAREKNWLVVRLMATSCRPSVQSFYESNVKAENSARCQKWKSNIGEYVSNLPKTDIIVTSGATQGYYHAPGTPDAERVADGFEAMWEPWLESGHRLLAISDVPGVSGDTVPVCIEKAKTLTDPCAAPRETAIGPDPILIAAERITDPNFASIDLYDYFCDEELCHQVVGGLIVLKDTNHMTGTFAETLSPYVWTTLKGLMR